jgi:hypothetical protein
MPHPLSCRACPPGFGCPGDLPGGGGGECPLLVSLDLVSGLAQKTTCELAITRSDYRTMPIKSGHPVCAALTPPVGADWY